MSSGTAFTVYDPDSGLSWKLQVLSPGRHCDSQPVTLQDTLIMQKAFDGKSSWNMHIVYVQLPNGTWATASAAICACTSCAIWTRPRRPIL